MLALSPTYYYLAKSINHWDIVFISPSAKSVTFVAFRDCILGIQTHHFAEL
jgi:hypothetical protein